MAKLRKNEKKYQTELVQCAFDIGGWGHKMQRAFIKGIPDVEAKAPLLPLVKLEVKHEPYSAWPQRIPVQTTQLQRLTLCKMQAAGIRCGWAVFVSIGKDHFVFFSADIEARWIYPSNSALGLHSDTGNFIQEEPWNKNSRLATFSKIINHMTTYPPFSPPVEQSTETSPTTPK